MQGFFVKSESCDIQCTTYEDNMILYDGFLWQMDLAEFTGVLKNFLKRLLF